MSDFPQHDPASYSLLTYAWVVGLSVWGGVANFCHKLRQGHSRPFNLAELFGELVISGFAGVIAFYLCEAAHIRPIMSAAAVGISGHMGSRAIFMIEHWAMKKWGRE